MPKIFSLCITTTNIKDENQFILFRLADKIENKLCERNYFENQLVDVNEQNAYPFPYTSFSNYENGELRIWEWDPLVRERAKKTLIPFYELFEVPGIASLTEYRIIKTLKNGCDIPNYFGQKSFLIISEQEEYYKVIEIDSSVLKKINGVIKLNKDAIKFNGYILNKNDVITTEKVKVVSSDGKILSPRKIYKNLNMKEPDFVLDILSFKEKVELFINKQIKIFNYSKSQQREIKNLLSEILSDYDQIDDFFRENGFDRNGLVGKINNVSYIITDILSDNNLWNKFSSAIIENIPELTDKFSKTIEEKFNEDNNKRIEEINSEILKREAKKISLLNECSDYERCLEKTKQEKKMLEENIVSLEKAHNDLKLALADKVSNIKNDMAGFLSQMAILEILGISDNKNIKNKKHYNSRLSDDMENEVDIIWDINEFIDILSLNLQSAAIEKEFSNVVSKFITATIIQKNQLFLLGKFASNVADALSATFCGRLADVISITGSEICLDDITEEINKCKSKVILIENILDSNESIALQLIRMNLNKLIIYGSDISETINFIPNSLINRFNFLCLDYFSGMISSEKFMYSDASKVLFENNISKYTYKAVKEELDKLLGSLIYSNSHCIAKTELISIIDGINDGNGLYTWLLCESIPHQIITNGREDLEEIVEMLDLSQKDINNLKNI